MIVLFPPNDYVSTSAPPAYIRIVLYFCSPLFKDCLPLSKDCVYLCSTYIDIVLVLLEFDFGKSKLA